MLENELVDINIISNNETGKIEVIENKPESEQFITSTLYFENKDIIKSLKIGDIKNTLKFYKKTVPFPTNAKEKASIKKLYDFGLVGNKKVLLERLVNFFIKDKIIINIQKRMRGYFARKFYSLLGPAKFNKSLCLNDTDFTTLEPINELPYDNFFSYQDKQGKIYGFQLSSLVYYAKKKKRHIIENPYNREIINYLLKDIYKLHRLKKIISTKFIPKKREIIVTKPVQKKSRHMYANIIENEIINNYQYNHTEMLENIRVIRNKPIIDRINALFIEIDALGNYSNKDWFINLDRRGYIRFFRILKDIWVYRAQIPSHIKTKISPLWDPFLVLSISEINDRNINELQSICLCIMEDLVFTGVDVEFRTLGSLHILSVLTVVNYDARNAMPWLYESLI